MYHLTAVIPAELSDDDARRRFAGPIDRALTAAGRLGRVTAYDSQADRLIC